MALRLLGLTKRYRDRTVLDGVSLHVRPGDCYGLLGHNGAGKTTAMRIALGLVRAESGRVLVEGFDAERHPREARARVGALVETAGFHGPLSGRENLTLLARLAGLGRRESAVEADRVLEVVGLAAAAHRPAGTYSQGMRQRLGIAQALLGRPRIVLLDEPTNGLDPEGIEEMRRVLRRLTRDEGTTVLLSSHQLHEVADLCSRIGILREGRRVLEEETEALLATHTDRHVVRTGDDAGAARLLASAGISAAPRADGGLDVSLGERPASDVLRSLVAAGIDVRAFAPHPVTLEEVYLHATKSEPRADIAASGPDAAASPRDRLAPSAPALRVARYDLRRMALRPAFAIALAAPAVAAVLAVRHRASAIDVQRARVAAGDLASATEATAFEAVAVALRAGLPFLALVVCAAGALSVAGEFAGGTLRNVLLRPVGRTNAVLGKALALAAVTLAGGALLVAASVGASAAWFEFGDLNELLITGDLFPLQSADAVWPDLRAALWMPLPGVAAFAALGLLVGATCRSGASAVAGAVATCAILAVAPAFGGGEWLPSAHVPLLGDSSQVQRLLDVARNVSNAAPGPGGGAIAVPLAWIAVAVAGACMLLRRRPIP